MTSSADAPTTVFAALGGHPFFERLVGAFYARVATDPILRPMYPEADLAAAEMRLRMFLEQYWGGPGTYSEERGHPRLGMRHRPFPIDNTASDHWLAHMRASLDELAVAPELDEMLWNYFQAAAPAMVNTR